MLRPHQGDIFEPSYGVGESIPKLIHQTGPWEFADIPAILQENIAALKERNPKWTHIYYSNSDVESFIRQEYDANIIDAYRKIDKRLGAARADFFRYLVLHRLGGIYLDIKSTSHKSFDQILLPEDKFILSQWTHEPEYLKSVSFREEKRSFGVVWLSNAVAIEDLSHIEGGEFLQWFIASAPGHPFLKSTISTVLKNILFYNPILHGYGKLGVLRVMGPIAYTLSIEALLQHAPYRYLQARKDLGLEYSVVPVSNKNEAETALYSSAHSAVFKQHYSHFHIPVVQLNWRKKAIILGLQPIVALFRLISGRRGY